LGLLFSLSPSQFAWASIACICQSLSQNESCECAHGCELSGGMHGESNDESEQNHSLINFSATDSQSPGTHGLTCCQPHQQNERPVVTLNQQLHIEAESGAAVVVPVVSATVSAAIRTQDAPRSRPLYIRHSCLLI
jgi:hypothetical protein